MSTAGPLKSVDYEVFGRVQGVCFRMYTEGEAKKIGVVGWVMNTSKGTVTGQVQGPEEKVNSIETVTGWSPGKGEVPASLPHPRKGGAEQGEKKLKKRLRKEAGWSKETWRRRMEPRDT
ncbi:acylphosphatase-2 isoform X2 [Talpa occidentalis]|uniref:acylphosphatase-2 isoform X2 n=1 Tax=Talpa occidentalis TaxID=50954 RepID=UPI0023F700D8|nr:acylphosphatase-2 isoform X2 [Talpa occidentalis]XP_054557420.1 acylphosphatase-2 isoform X2 [Talpa occidentalis]